MNKVVSQVTLLTIGSLMFAAGIYFFRMPNNFIVGGASGLAIILSRLFPYISKGEYVTVINIICIIAGLAVLGKGFSWKTIYCSAVYSLFIMLLENTVHLNDPLTDELFTELVLSVILCGVGAGIVINAGGSTGGVEIFALIVQKKSRYTVGNALMVFNLIIAVSAAWLFGLKTCFMSVIGVLIHSIIVDKVIQWFNSEKLMLIVTENAQEICEIINNRLEGCATVMNSVGSYKNKENRFILVAMEPKKAAMLKKSIKRMNKNVFIVSLDIFEISGGRI